ncbi:MAG TPA: hypothetical protein VH105_09420 [Burkholderiales bacterium]|jgi:hypothetical protein|nr:hypothetical protein [Burkholderiales bacterium]
MSDTPRNLTEDDVIAVVDELERRLVERFFSNVGKGVWQLVWRALVALMVLLAAYGAIKAAH